MKMTQLWSYVILVMCHCESYETQFDLSNARRPIFVNVRLAENICFPVMCRFDFVPCKWALAAIL